MFQRSGEPTKFRHRSTNTQLRSRPSQLGVGFLAQKTTLALGLRERGLLLCETIALS
ncbi:hypothetical protein Hgul01_02830 [Herpetosiphon gulosus]|uniref:Uncharacterized protein n=1 Tax=Herpetosiphon gulosus TaxID=1973496 RepID=A0ABP9X0Q1_9CHLR